MADLLDLVSAPTAHSASPSPLDFFHDEDVDGRLADTDEDLEFIEEGEQEDEDAKPSVFNQSSNGKDKEGERISPGQESRQNGDGENKENEKERNVANGKIGDLENSDRGAGQGRGARVLPEANSKPTAKRAPLTLVELPVDVLKEIVKEVGSRFLLYTPEWRPIVRNISICPPPSCKFLLLLPRLAYLTCGISDICIG